MAEFAQGIAKSVGKTVARQRANEVLERYHPTDKYPIDVEAIVKKHNIGLVIHPLPSEQFGLLVINKAGKAVIVANAKHSKTRQRVTVAHELGHYLLHWHGDVEVFHKDTRGRLGTNRQEVDADTFAATLLMPEALLRCWVDKLHADGVYIDAIEDAGGVIRDMATKLHASEQAVLVRLEQLKLFDNYF